jgi:hypothetical protein
MRILHLSVVRELSAGQRKQLNYEFNTANHLKGTHWEVRAYHTGSIVEPFERKIPTLFSPILLRYLYAWFYLLKVSRNYDFVLCRHMVFDPFTILFGWFVPNRISIHHAKEIEELILIRSNWKGKLASIVEQFTGWVNSHQVYAIMGVTREITTHQVKIKPAVKKSFTYPNGIIVESVPSIPDERDTKHVTAAFICGHFSEWHGLELLISACMRPLKYSNFIKIYLLGKLTKQQMYAIEESNRVNNVFKVLGFLKSEDYQSLLASCDIGISSFALEKKKLKEGATLKVREYLAQGLGVFAGHADTALNSEFKYYKISEPDPDQIYEFGYSLKRTSRAEVIAAAQPFIDKKEIMRKTVVWLSDQH